MQSSNFTPSMLMLVAYSTWDRYLREVCIYIGRDWRGDSSNCFIIHGDCVHEREAFNYVEDMGRGYYY